jgi:hypothetical protein
MAIAFAASSQPAQKSVGTRPAFAAPTAAEIDAVIALMLFCDLQGKDSKEQVLISRVLNHFESASKRNPGGKLPGGPFRAHGATFDEVSTAAWSDIIVWGWSAKGRPDRLEQTLRSRGHTVGTLAPDSLKMPGLDRARGFKQLTIDRQLVVAILPGRLMQGIGGKDRLEPGGATLLCIAGKPSNADVERVYGTPSLTDLQSVLRGGEKRDKAWYDNIIDKGQPVLQEAVAGYTGLEAGQVQRLLALRNENVAATLLHNEGVQLSVAQIDALIALRQPRVLYILSTSKAFRNLTPEQQAALRSIDATRQDAVLRSGGPQAVALLRSLIQSGKEDSLHYFVWTDPMSPEMVDSILQLGTPALRSHLAMNSQFMYSPAQIERMLTDPVRDVVVGVLRRNEIDITREQYDRGIDTAPPDVAFWYRSKDRFVPTPAQIEAGLTAAEASTRRGWAMDLRYTPTPAQTRRAMQDDAIVTSFLGRRDVIISDAEFEACTTATDVGVRFACVSRPDYPLTQARFEAIASDWNSNVLRFFLERKGVERPDLDPFIRQALVSAKVDVLLSMAANSALPLEPAHFELASRSPHEKVRQAFCRRQSKPCPP